MWRVLITSALAVLLSAAPARAQGCYGSPAGYGYSGGYSSGYGYANGWYNGAGGGGAMGRPLGYAGPASSMAAPRFPVRGHLRIPYEMEALPPPVVQESRTYEGYNGGYYGAQAAPPWSFAPSPVSYYQAPRRPLLSARLNVGLNVGGRRGGGYCPTCP